MKTPEDEAFDELARKQGSWGGGYRAKRAAAADKLQEPWNEDEWRKNNWRCQHGWLRGEQCEICNASLAPKPAQEPIYKITVIDNAHPKGIPFEDWVQPVQDVDYWIREATAARQAEMAMRRELEEQPAQEPVNLLEARRIAAEYGTLDSQVDNGNLYFALSKCLEHIDAQPAQEPVQSGPIPKAQSLHELMNRMNQSLQKADMEADMLTISYQSGYHDGKKAALAGREWNFCERCGKRTADLTVIHTCTPPQGDA